MKLVTLTQVRPANPLAFDDMPANCKEQVRCLVNMDLATVIQPNGTGSTIYFGADAIDVAEPPGEVATRAMGKM
jgi:hypothetical protein